MRICHILAVALLMAPVSVGAQSLPGDAASGQALALRSCAGCHAVAERQSRPATDGAPSFLALARDPAITELSLRAFLQTPHARMPSIMLTRREMDDVISYILGMRRNN